MRLRLAAQYALKIAVHFVRARIHHEDRQWCIVVYCSILFNLVKKWRPTAFLTGFDVACKGWNPCQRIALQPKAD